MSFDVQISQDTNPGLPAFLMGARTIERLKEFRDCKPTIVYREALPTEVSAYTQELLTDPARDPLMRNLHALNWLISPTADGALALEWYEVFDGRIRNRLDEVQKTNNGLPITKLDDLFHEPHARPFKQHIEEFCFAAMAILQPANRFVLRFHTLPVESTKRAHLDNLPTAIEHMGGAGTSIGDFDHYRREGNYNEKGDCYTCLQPEKLVILQPGDRCVPRHPHKEGERTGPGDKSLRLALAITGLYAPSVSGPR